MKRRRFLAGLGAVGGGYWYARRQPRESIEIRYWLSERGADYEVHDRITEYVGTALSTVYDTVDLSFGGVVSVQTEHGYGVTTSGEWPRQVLHGYQGANGLEPVTDVNVLVTDGSMKHAPTGIGVYNLASVGGARYLERTPPRAGVPDVVPYESSMQAMQVLLHEIGHVLGLAHEHGSIETVDGGTVASPMVSTYAWVDERGQFSADRCACGGLYPERRDGNYYLSFDFSPCARQKLQTYRGRFRP
ncbi:peptidase M10A and M12B matrixin and adamalysin [Natrialbaceae archaeon A-CW3]